MGKDRIGPNYLKAFLDPRNTSMDMVLDKIGDKSTKTILALVKEIGANFSTVKKSHGKDPKNLPGKFSELNISLITGDMKGDQEKRCWRALLQSHAVEERLGLDNYLMRDFGGEERKLKALNDETNISFLFEQLPERIDELNQLHERYLHTEMPRQIEDNCYEEFEILLGRCQQIIQKTILSGDIEQYVRLYERLASAFQKSHSLKSSLRMQLNSILTICGRVSSLRQRWNTISSRRFPMWSKLKYTKRSFRHIGIRFGKVKVVFLPLWSSFF